MFKPIRQALVLVGGKATRLRAGGVEVPLSKSFLMVAGQPLLFWNLLSLHQSGVRSLIVVGDQTVLLCQAQRALQSLPLRFKEVIYFHDQGNGAHGIPYEARYLLDETFIFECGHSISQPVHYRRLAEAKTANNIVFSAFTAHPQNRRQPVQLSKSGVYFSDAPYVHYALAHPIVADKAYACSLLKLRFSIAGIFAHYQTQDRLQFVVSNMPPEFDIAPEARAAQIIYRRYLPLPCKC